VSRLLAPVDVYQLRSFRIYVTSFNVNCDNLDPMQIGFTPRQVTKMTGVPYSTLNLWAKIKLIEPSIAAGSGSGYERIYSFKDLISLKVAFELRKAGVTTRSLKKVVEFLRENEGIKDPLSEARLVVSGKDVVAVRSKAQLVSALSQPGQGCLSFVVDLPRTLGELEQVAHDANAFAIGVSQLQDASKDTRKPPVSATGKQRRKVRH
jgi:DNA-binding transcriptional MerR regulator